MLPLATACTSFDDYNTDLSVPYHGVLFEDK